MTENAQKRKPLDKTEETTESSFRRLGRRLRGSARGALDAMDGLGIAVVATLDSWLAYGAATLPQLPAKVVMGAGSGNYFQTLGLLESVIVGTAVGLNLGAAYGKLTRDEGNGVVAGIISGCVGLVDSIIGFSAYYLATHPTPSPALNGAIVVSMGAAAAVTNGGLVALLRTDL